MKVFRRSVFAVTGSAALILGCGGGGGDGGTQEPPSLAIAAPGSLLAPVAANKEITAADCTAAKLGASIPANLIGERVSGVSLNAPTWTAAAGTNQAYCTVTGDIHPVDPSAPPIKFKVALPSSWSLRAVHTGGGGMNGSVPGAPSPEILGMGAATWGSDSGHSGFGSQWALNEEPMLNFSYMQMKKTRDASVELVQRMYGEKPRFTYWQGNSQGGREGLTVAQRYPNDYDGVVVTVPVLSFSSLSIAPDWMRIQEKPLANWVPNVKAEAIRTEFMRQCDKLDGLVDGIINNYQACRALFNAKNDPSGRNPWISKRCPDNIDPNPTDNTASACFTDGQIDTLKFMFSSYNFATPLAHGATSFGMWMPTTEVPGFILNNSRHAGQEGAAVGAAPFRHLGSPGATGFLFKDLNANTLDYVEGGALNARRLQTSEYMDSANPDLSAFYKRGGKLLAIIGTNDSLASTGAQLDYYQAVVDTMKRPVVNAFARLWVLPQTGHGLSGSNVGVNGDGATIPVESIPNAFKGLEMLKTWVETNEAPSLSPTVTATTAGVTKTLPMCSYPTYPKYVQGPAGEAASYTCAD